MDSGFEVTNPRRALLVGATATGSLLVGVIAVVALLVVPLLSRVDMTLETLNSSLPILEQVGPDVGTLRSDVDEITPDVDSLEETVLDVSSGLGMVNDSVDQLQPPLGTVDESIRSVDDSVQLVADRVVTLDESVRRMEGRLGTLDVLPEVLAEMRRTTEGIGRITGHTAALNDELGRVVDALDRTTALLADTEQHVENLDRKTGPVLLPDGDGRSVD